jgi:hypothetical protein
MKIWRRCLGVAMVVVLMTSGCGPTLGESFKKIESVPPKKALVYIYRPFGSVGFMWSVDVLANGKVAVTLAHASYYPYFVDPGEIEFRSKRTGTFSESVTLDAKAGRTYYLKTIIRAGSLGLVGQTILTIMPQEEGEKEIEECNLVLDTKT